MKAEIGYEPVQAGDVRFVVEPGRSVDELGRADQQQVGVGACLADQLERFDRGVLALPRAELGDDAQRQVAPARWAELRSGRGAVDARGIEAGEVHRVVHDLQSRAGGRRSHCASRVQRVGHHRRGAGRDQPERAVAIGPGGRQSRT